MLLRFDLLKLDGGGVLVLIWLASVFGLCNGSPGSGWIKVCGDATYLIHAGGCPYGVKLGKEIAVSCVCVYGVWILLEESCDTNAFVLVGKGECFNLEDARVSVIKYVGRASNPFSPGTYVGGGGFEKFWKLSPDRRWASDALKFDKGNIINIMEDKVVSGKELACCSRDPANTLLDSPVQICLEIPPGEYLLRSKCQYSALPLADLRRISLTFGEGIRVSVPRGPHNAINETQILQPSTTCNYCRREKNIRYETDCCSALPFEAAQDHVVVDERKYEKQTNYMIGKHIEFVLKQVRTSPLKTFEFAQLRFSTAILEKVCPSDQVPVELLKTFLRFFKYALNESIQEYPMEKTMDDEENERILESLRTCYASVQSPWTIKYGEGSCDPEIDKIVTTAGEFNIDLPPHEKFNLDIYDPVLETIWKIVQFIHYFCSTTFQKNPTDADYFITGLHRLFTVDLQRRWTHPGRTYQAINFVLPNYHLEKFGQALDACVYGAKQFSGRKPWLPRPFQKRPLKSAQKSYHIWQMGAICLTTQGVPGEARSRCGYNKLQYDLKKGDEDTPNAWN